jgi:hypothetical protein
MGLQSYSTTQADPAGLRGVARFQYGIHGSLINPVFPEITAEMQGQAASFLASDGTFVQVSNPDVLVPVIQVQLRSPAPTRLNPFEDHSPVAKRPVSGDMNRVQVHPAGSHKR